ncbi:MAG: M20/M25/M40 family metallo-hydrolase [candidate division WOR-3 bacterium]|nr:M20/M25/M40 family metallo-hydrolase [candidate division WOR-3 bacterium]
MLNKNRLKSTFIKLLTIDSPSGKEGNLARYLSSVLKDIGLSVRFDSANRATGGDTGNLIAPLPGDDTLSPIMLNAHLDTIESTEGSMPLIKGDIIKSDGNSILGADDKSGIACIVEALRIITENKLPHPPIEVVFTVCEENGLLGAKNLDYSVIKAKMSYALDTGSPFAVVVGAPYHNGITVKVFGREAHAGSDPSKGINAIKIAADAISKIDTGQIDEETTANIGIIRGGTATNIVPGFVEVKAEVRSHNEEKLERKTKEIVSEFKKSCSLFSNEIDSKPITPEARYKIIREYNAFRIDEEEEIVKGLFKAASGLNIQLKARLGGGGSDANIFNEKGITTVLLGTGMKNVHTKSEYINLEDMVICTKLLINTISSSG